ncbi:Protein cfxQ like [Apostasia shenzhenica]|uniref:Protein cfxQ like n=1 Tax=Apostasia shenzhenica TaxID=1088818 RepID=A0A2I0AG38_9ASPA|nr:Protein cfxQ like [Apostasia shenzhenica]
MAVGEMGVAGKRLRPAKPMTIHGCAQSGDLSGLQKRLQENPSLLNAKNAIVRLLLLFFPFSCLLLARLTVCSSCSSCFFVIIGMAQTPLHVAAGYNEVDVVNYLLQWKGPEKVELESKNMYGETPLHMAAKNGCCESARLLLSCGASLEAKANNGMTPLHLAVWHAQQAQDSATVNTLLEYNADCGVKDNIGEASSGVGSEIFTIAIHLLNEGLKLTLFSFNVSKEGLTPLNHVSEGPSSWKLREVLKQHMDKQRKIKALEACYEAQLKMENFEAAIASIVGLESLKLQLHKWARGMIFDEKRRAMGLNIAARKVPHMAFLGNPGTGKTMVARALGKLLHMIGVLPTDKVTEVQRTDLVGEFVGHTGPKTRKKLQDAEGGILFVDEAYRLIPMQKSDDKDYGLEALEEIMSVMDNGKIVIIFAGYCEPMKRIINSNEGFCRRVSKFFYFDDLNPTELAQILLLKMNDQERDNLLYGFKLHPSCTVQAIAELIQKETSEKQRKEMNGGLIDPMLTSARENLDVRLDFNCSDADSLVTITMEDLEEGIRSLSQ